MTTGVLGLASDVHDQLLRLVAPASPGSIEASSLRPSRNPALFAICLFAAASFAIFVIPIVISAVAKDLLNKDLNDMLQIIGGAGLGSSFYALHTASHYIESGRFDPKYNNTYLIRFGLGLLSGLILAYFLKDFLNINTTNSNGPTLAKIGVSALALVGGYAAEAVAQILDRVSDTLVALVSGSDKDKIEAAKQKADADSDKKTTQAISETVRKLQQAVNDTDPKAAVQKVMADLLNRR
jgi:mannitol-specific phosphotransferase system IIBC component